MSYDASKIAFVDTETTGLDVEYHVVWEIAVIADGHEHVWQQKVGKSGMFNADPEASKLTNFELRYQDDDALSPEASIAMFDGLTQGRHLVGACPWFDSERMHRTHRAFVHNYDQGSTSRDGYYTHRRHPWHYHLIDVETLTVGYMMGQEPHDKHPDITQAFDKTALPWKSEELSRYLGVEPDDFQPKHSALADARWAKAMFEAIMGPPE